ncbi:MAG: pyridoxamine 5'-phosphate oxidase family protein [Alphaproteobacteria bacterium]|jgi:general stress protein 26|nr:pyridoxamine 5'-phosphate oxidase family protein [Alphaproteobacteria bacterium]
MPNQKEIEDKLWSAIKSDRTIMLALEGQKGGASQPMTAILEDDSRGPVWIFSASDVDLVQALDTNVAPAVAQFVSKGHDLFASLHGHLRLHTEASMIDRLWNPFIAAWYDGKKDPNLRLLRLDLDHAHVWLNENSLLAGVKMLFGNDPKADYKDKTADISL